MTMYEEFWTYVAHMPRIYKYGTYTMGDVRKI